ncbi:hypothetical protein M5K25_024586 [Dendrobium thyrsiflorum]|uniref:Uncharacterized protein n=1 Tax=Dendrobium thyrsiflorum TaxID=117978 RepID=A0ABD0U2K6_DENTH
MDRNEQTLLDADFNSSEILQVNLQKSSILMGKNVGRKRKKKIAKLLNMKVVEEREYLGIKIALRRLRKTDFQNLLDKASRKLNVWGNKFISMAGRITLLKYAFLTLPLYMSSHSLVPLSILKEFDKACRNYLWNKHDGSHGFHYVAWDTLCKPKEHGGLGLSSAVSRVGPLRARFAWNLIDKPNTLLNRNIVDKYGSLWWKNEGKRCSSATWKILIDGWNSLKGILRWSIATDSMIDIQKDVWILDRSLERWPTFVTNWGEEIVSLNSFIVDRAWDVSKLYYFFGDELINLITKVDILKNLEEDKLELKFKLSRKSISALSYGARFSEYKEEVWYHWFFKLKLHPRVELFMWRLCMNAIPTAVFLFARRMADSNLCPWGCLKAEDVDHCSTTCQKLLQAISLLNSWGFPVPRFGSFSECLNKLRDVSVRNPFLPKMYFTLIFHSWLNRNRVKYGDGEESIVSIASSVVSFMATTNKGSNVLGNWGTNQSSSLLNFWYPPPPNWLKINIDGALAKLGKSGVGGVVRDGKGRFLLAYGSGCVHWDSAQVELLAFQSLRNLIQGWMHEADGIIIEGDNRNIINFLHNLYSIPEKKNKDQRHEDLFLKTFANVFFNLVHGLLHLLGFDHEVSNLAEEEMEKEEELVLTTLGWKGKGLIKSAYDSISNGSHQAQALDDTDQSIVEVDAFPYRQKIRYIFCDMDGTLLNSKSQITLRTVEALNEAISRGVRIVIATGKSRPAVMRAFKIANLAGNGGIVNESSPGVFLQGLLVYGRKGREICRRNLDRNVCKEILSYSLEHSVPAVAFSEDRCFTVFDHPLVESLHEIYHEPKAEVIPAVEQILSSFEIQVT